MRDASSVAEGVWYTAALFFLSGASIIWVSLEAQLQFHHKLVVGLLGGLFGAVALLTLARFVQMGDSKHDAKTDGTGTIIGHSVVGNNQGGAALEIQSHGTSQNPSVGAEVSVMAPAGQSVIGTRVIQNGPGTGMRVIQNGPGVGFRSSVVIGPNGKK